MCALVVCALTTENASAQLPEIAKRVGIGGSVGGIFPNDDDVNAGLAGGVSFGLAPAGGLGPTMGFGWYEGDLALPRVSGNVGGGRVRGRPRMAAMAHSWVKARVATGLSTDAGISFSSIRLDDQYRAFFGSGREVRVEPDNRLATRPQLRVEYPVARKVGVYSSAG